MGNVEPVKAYPITNAIGGTTEFLPDADQESAMQRFWSARSGGDATATLKKLPDPPDDDPPPAAPSNGTPPPRTTPERSISVLASERIQLQEQWLSKAGFSVPPPLYTPGTRVIRLGDQNFRTERQRVEHMPLFSEAAATVTELVTAEAREDLEIGLKSLSMTEDGKLLVDGQKLTLESGAFYQLALLGGFGMGARYLARLCDPSLRALNVNQQLQQRDKDKTVTLRTRQTTNGSRGVFATVTPTYAAVDTDQVLKAVVEDLSDARTELRYDGTGIRATALWMPDQVVDLSAGDIFKAGIRIETDDTGRGRIRISAVVFRNRCLNLIIIGEGTVETVAQVHRGDPRKILEVVRGGVEAARDKIGDFLEAWGHARTVKVEPERLFDNWLSSGKLKLPGKRDRRQTVEEFLTAWGKEPGDSLAHCVNAVTRAAHENPFWTIDVREDLERQAAQLVYATA